MARRIVHRESSPFTGGYSSARVTGWARGEVRDIDDDEAADYLLRTFPEAFEVAAELEFAPEPHPELRELVERLKRAFDAGASAELPDLIAQIRASEHLGSVNPVNRLWLDGLLGDLESGRLLPASPGPASAGTDDLVVHDPPVTEPTAKPETPAAEPTTEPEAPTTEPEAPTTEPEPTAELETSTAELETSTAELETSTAELETSTAELDGPKPRARKG